MELHFKWRNYYYNATQLLLLPLLLPCAKCVPKYYTYPYFVLHFEKKKKKQKTVEVVTQTGVKSTATATTTVTTAAASSKSKLLIFLDQHQPLDPGKKVLPRILDRGVPRRFVNPNPI